MNSLTGASLLALAKSIYYNDIYCINLDRLVKVIGFPDTYPLDSMIVGG